MAARERHHDQHTARTTRRLTWPTIVLTGGVLLSLAANLDQAQPDAWGRITAATPAAAFLVAVSMLERRAARQSSPRQPSPPVPAVPAQDGVSTPVLPSGPAPGPTAPLLDYARRIAAEYHAAHGHPINRDALRARLGVSNQLASDLLRHIRTSPDPAREAAP